MAFATHAVTVQLDGVFIEGGEVTRPIVALAGLLIALVAGQAWAADATPSTDRRLELARRYMEASQTDRMIDGMMSSMRPVMEQQFKSLTVEKRSALSKVFEDTMHELMDDVMVDMLPLVAETFTEKELEELIAFYEGPTGRAVLEKMPLMMGKMVPIMQKRTPEFQRKIMEGVCEALDCKEGDPKPSVS